MDSVEIREILNKHCPKYFSGVFAADDYEITKIPGFLVLNTHERNKTGEHWVCLYVNENRSEFFDSLGLPPLYYHRYWHETLLKISPSYCYNTDRLQEIGSSICGELCIIFIVLRNYGFSFESILKMLTKIDLKAFISRLV